MKNDQNNTDEILGITRCATCGHRLDGEIECPFCSAMEGSGIGPYFAGKKQFELPKWIYVTACFLTAPFSAWYILRSPRLGTGLKTLCLSGVFLWLALLYKII